MDQYKLPKDFNKDWTLRMFGMPVNKAQEALLNVIIHNHKIKIERPYDQQFYLRGLQAKFIIVDEAKI